MQQAGRLYYAYGKELRPVLSSPITIRYRSDRGMTERTFVAYRTHHGPIVRAAGGSWIAVRLMQEPVKALTESYLRTKATSYDGFKALLDLKADSSNNTVYADADGNIAFFLANFIPRRNTGFDWTKPVAGSDPATEWQGLHPVDTLPNLKNPSNGWIQNTNDWPYSAAGPKSPKVRDFPAYMDKDGENARGIHAMHVLSGHQSFTLDSLIAAAFDSELPAFDELLPPLFAAYRAEPDPSLKSKLRAQVAALESWDRRWSSTSVSTTLAVYWANQLRRTANDGAAWSRWEVLRTAATRRSPKELLEALAVAADSLKSDFGTWEVPWGEVNRFQRLAGDIDQGFSDSGPSTPIPFTPGIWGSLAAFQAKTYPGTKRMYGTAGNSFVAVVEFGKTVRAKAISAGGESSDPRSPHFNDQVDRYAAGALRDVYFYRQDLEKHLVREYHPGD
jgi:acyl-homoserine-lactone acylase